MRIRVFQHMAFEGPAKIEEWAKDRHHTLTYTRFFMNDPVPTPEEFDLLVVMGGPMGAMDDHRFQWMANEKRLIKEAIEGGKRVLGICLGAQLIAAALGAKVFRNPETEIGWWPIELNPPNVRQHPLNVLPQRATVFHWHGDTFNLPKGAVHLARSRACENQAFAIGKNVVGLQFHLEVAGPHIEGLLQAANGDLREGSFIQDPREMMAWVPTQVPPLNAALFRFLDHFAA